MVTQDQLKNLSERVSKLKIYLDIDKKLIEISNEEEKTADPDFWNNPQEAQAMIKELQELKDAADGKGKYDRNDAVFTIVAGAGGDDAEDFARMLVEMYQRFAETKGWGVTILDSNTNDLNGYRNITRNNGVGGQYAQPHLCL